MKIIEAHGASIPALGLGTYTLKGDQCVDLVAKAIETGYRHIDTARMYENEASVGEGIRQSGADRADLFVTTKVWWTDISGAQLIEAAKSSVDRLGIGPVDLLLIHWPNPDIALEESIDALNGALAQGFTKHIGVANFPNALFREAVTVSDKPLVCNQVEYHPMLSQNSVLEACRQNGSAMISYSPIGKGGDLLGQEPITRIAEAHGRSPAQIVLAWHMSQDNVGAIPRTSNPDRLSENISVFDIELGEDEIAEISALASPDGRLIDPSFAPVWDRD
ncbi:aldo/keto reductase [Fulvimarina endophytica]|uniref:Aldo/keto reductase n=1 Tax=Fulvimarina endophytica TaxID=2293836 RepID=A0A371X7C8_9HYPH|nr:aldo/keto reductase [Fulvimarina endophytica]RFC65116.1 aldo/keto reductase [Fulvimarina endophytica]